MAYTNIDDPSAYFQTALYAGNNTTDHNIANDGNSDLQPDLVWIKQRTSNNPHTVQDTSRGFAGNGEVNLLVPNTTGAEATNGAFESFNTNGFGVGGTNVASGAYNLSGSNYVAWQWKANGGTTTSVSASGIGFGCVNACTYQANTTAGFSIITYTGRDDQLINGRESKLTHGLGVAPDATIMKRRDGTGDWFVMGAFDGANGYPYSTNQFLKLNGTETINGNYYVGDTAPDATHIFLGNEFVNIASATYVCYAFAEKQGYSKFGKYVGNGNTNGAFIYTGFKPAFVMVKRSDGTSDWTILDNKREGYNLINKRLVANSSAAEATYNVLDFVSNGFKFRDGDGIWNGSGSTYIYMAFAENPFTTSTGIPTTAR